MLLLEIMNRKGTRIKGKYFNELKDPCRKARSILRGYLCCKVEYITIITPHWHPPFPEWGTASDLSGPAPAPSNFQLAHIFVTSLRHLCHIFKTSLSHLKDIFVTSFVIFATALPQLYHLFNPSMSHCCIYCHFVRS